MKHTKRVPIGLVSGFRYGSKVKTILLGLFYDLFKDLAQSIQYAAGGVNGSDHHLITIYTSKVQVITGPLCQLPEIEPLHPAISFPEGMKVIERDIKVYQFVQEITSRQPPEIIILCQPTKRSPCKRFYLIGRAKTGMLLAQVYCSDLSGPFIKAFKKKAVKPLIIYKV